MGLQAAVGWPGCLGRLLSTRQPEEPRPAWPSWDPAQVLPSWVPALLSSHPYFLGHESGPAPKPGRNTASPAQGPRRGHTQVASATSALGSPPPGRSDATSPRPVWTAGAVGRKLGPYLGRGVQGLSFSLGKESRTWGKRQVGLSWLEQEDS